MTIATMRILIPDKAHYDRSTATGDGAAVEFAVPNSPIYTGTAKVYVGGILQTTPADYVIDEALGLVTFTVAPLLGTAIVVTYQYTIFSDADLTAMLAAEGAVDKQAVALALETMASNEAFVQKVIKTLDLSTDGRATATALMERAKLLRQQAAGEEQGFDIAEMVPNSFAERERLLKQWQRGVIG